MHTQFLTKITWHYYQAHPCKIAEIKQTKTQNQQRTSCRSCL